MSQPVGPIKKWAGPDKPKTEFKSSDVEVDYEAIEQEQQHQFALKNRAMDPRGSI